MYISPKVIYQIAPDDNAQYARYRAGQLDVTDSVPTSAIDTLRSQGSSELVIAPFLRDRVLRIKFVGAPNCV